MLLAMSSRAAGTLQSLGLLILRLGAGGLLLSGHGWAKIAHFSERAAPFADPLGVGSALSLALVVFAEVFCAALVAVGLATRLASIPIIIFLFVAAFLQHADAPWSKKELALVYLVPFLAILATGGGRFALDALVSRFFSRPARGSES